MRPKPSIRILLIVCIITISILCDAQPETVLSNNDVVNMVGSGLSMGIVKAAIGRSKTNFDLSPGALIQLKKSGMPDDILLTMPFTH